MMTLLIGHGRKHRRLPGIDYDRTFFLDINPEVKPDFIIDIREENVLLSFDFSFREIIAVNCETSILPKFPRDQRQGNLLRNETLNNLDYFLEVGGIIYLKTPNLFERIDFQKEIERKTNWKSEGIIFAGDVIPEEKGFFNIFIK